MATRWNLNIQYHSVVLGALPAGATTALDVGSGDGLLAFDLAERGLDVVGIDLDQASVDRARSDPAGTDRTTFVHADVFTYPFELGSFDVVAADAMLHQVDARAGIRRLVELCRPGGTVAIVGFAKPSGPWDWVLIGAGGALTRAKAATGSLWHHHAPMCWPPPLRIREMRTIIAAEMPGARFRRGMSHRYTVVWSKPIEASSA